MILSNSYFLSCKCSFLKKPAAYIHSKSSVLWTFIQRSVISQVLHSICVKRHKTTHSLAGDSLFYQCFFVKVLCRNIGQIKNHLQASVRFYASLRNFDVFLVWCACACSLISLRYSAFDHCIYKNHFRFKKCCINYWWTHSFLFQLSLSRLFNHV